MPIEETSAERWDRIRAETLKDRAYCPTCGEVHQGRKYWMTGEWYVPDHYKFYGTRYSRCPGGKIDITKDRAP